MGLAPESLSLELVSIAELAMFNEDLEETPPREWVSFREKIRDAHGLLFLTPEYNRSIGDSGESEPAFRESEPVLLWY